MILHCGQCPAGGRRHSYWEEVEAREGGKMDGGEDSGQRRGDTKVLAHGNNSCEC